MAKHVISTDFTEKFVKENERVNGPNCPNVTFETCDATKLNYLSNSFDCIFFSWLLAYLSNEEIQECASNLLRYIGLNRNE